MKIRLIESGFEKMTGWFGPVEFKDGVSVDDVTQVQANRLASLVRIETVEDAPKNPSVAQQIIDSQSWQMDAKMSREVVPQPIPEEKKKWTREELEALADKDGIEGLRPIGTSLNVKSNSIVTLIAKILHAQAPQVAQTPVAETGQEAVSIEMPVDPEVKSV